MNRLKHLLIIFPLFVFNSNLHAQRTISLGFSGGGIRFYPEAQHMGSNRNNSMSNGWGWSAGIVAEDHWRPKIHQVVELNYYNLSSDVFLQKNPDGFWSPYNENDPRKPVYGNFKGTSFSQVSVAGGIKYFMNNKLFVSPGIEFARMLNADVDINRNTYNIKAGAGVHTGAVDVMLEYAYGLKYQRIVYDPNIPFASTQRNRYLQLKINIPVCKFR